MTTQTTAGRLRRGSLFDGYGGLDEAVEQVLGGELAWLSEIDPAASRISAHHRPGVPNLGDITKVDWDDVEHVQILSGGSPCQDLSTAGKQGGMTEGTRSNLWVSMREAIDNLRPDLVVWENVRGALSAKASSDMELAEGRVGTGDDGPVLRALGRVLGDLGDLGYDASWQGLRASDVGAPHQRFRVFVVAWPAADAHIPRLEGRRLGGGRRGERAPRQSSLVDWGRYEEAVRRWERLTRPAPLPWDEFGRLSAAFSEWMMGLPAGHVTQVPGLSRSDQLKALGNGVVVQQAVAALRILLPDAGIRAAA